jgi:NAD-dependent deacetylase
MQKKNIVILTGAGISAESGIKTFRDSNGLWNGHNVEDVATPMAFKKNPQLVLDFYNARRKDIIAAAPNAAHLGLVELEKYYDVQIITQNIDDLHERAGSKNVLHLHGQIMQMRSVLNDEKLYAYKKDIKVGDVAEDGGQLRPHIVWFHEAVPAMEQAVEICMRCDLMIVIGTSLVVYPAAGLVNYAPISEPLYVIDKVIPEINAHNNIIKIEQPATIGVQQLIKILLPST